MRQKEVWIDRWESLFTPRDQARPRPDVECMTNTSPPSSNGSEPEPPFMPLHTAVVLLMAVVIGLVAGCLTALTDASVAGAALVGLTAAGASVPVLRTLIGRG